MTHERFTRYLGRRRYRGTDENNLSVRAGVEREARGNV